MRIQPSNTGPSLSLIEASLIGKFLGEMGFLSGHKSLPRSILNKCIHTFKQKSGSGEWADATPELCQTRKAATSTILDEKGDPCIIVIKNGATTGLTLGRVTGIKSFVHVYKDYAIESTFMEMPVYSFEEKATFSAPGDSGSVVADGNGRIVGMLTGGCGRTDLTDVSYVTPYYFLEERIKKAFPNSHLFPTRESA